MILTKRQHLIVGGAPLFAVLGGCSYDLLEAIPVKS